MGMEKRPADTTVLEGDSIDLLGELPEDSFHAVVCDPPYNFEGGFMGTKWDNIGSPKEYQQWCEEWARAALHPLKPGGHLIAFSGNRTHHRLFSGVEDAGFELRDTILWLYGSGFPKGSRLSTYLDGDEAERWGDWRPMLKPAFEPAVLARAPFSGSATANQVENGTGALNVESGRILTDESLARKIGNGYAGGRYANSEKMGRENAKDSKTGFATEDNDGRYPPNVAMDTTAAGVLDNRNDKSESVRSKRGDGIGDGYHGSNAKYDTERGYDDEGGPSRFFYTSKSSKAERAHDGQIQNDHPTVKPIDLMEWLVGLVTAEDQWVLDPFCGSGTTLLACQNTGRKVVGIDADPDSVLLSQTRVMMNE